MTDPRPPRPLREVRLLVGTFLVSGCLLATNLGEFWPFSIYPMFSKAGGAWTRAVVLEVPLQSGALDGGFLDDRARDSGAREVGTDRAPHPIPDDLGKSGRATHPGRATFSRTALTSTPYGGAGEAEMARFWAPRAFEHPHLTAVPVAAHGVDPIDLANYVSKTRQWDARRADGVRVMFDGGPGPGATWVLTRVRGHLRDGPGGPSGRLELRLEPILAILPDTVLLNPHH